MTDLAVALTVIIFLLTVCLAIAVTGWRFQTRRADTWRDRAYEELRRSR